MAITVVTSNCQICNLLKSICQNAVIKFHPSANQTYVLLSCREMQPFTAGKHFQPVLPFLLLQTNFNQIRIGLTNNEKDI